MRMNKLTTAICYYNIGRYTSYMYSFEQQKKDQLAAQEKIIALNIAYKEDGGNARLIYSPSKDTFRLEFAS